MIALIFELHNNILCRIRVKVLVQILALTWCILIIFFSISPA